MGLGNQKLRRGPRKLVAEGIKGAALLGALMSLVLSGLQARAAKEAPAAQDEAVAGLVKELESIQKQKDSKGIYSSDFESTFWSARTGRSRLSKGRVSYQAPNRFRWEVESPESETYVSTGVELWKHNAAAKHAQQLPLKEAGLEFLKAIMDPAELGLLYEIKAWESAKSAKEADSVAAKFDVRPEDATKKAGDPQKIFVRLVPKRSDAAEEYLYLIADQKSGQVDEIRIAFQNGNRNTIRFNQWERTDGGLGKLFEFEPPPGTAVDRLTKGSE